MYRFLASSSEEKREWFGLLHSHIFTQKKLFHKVIGISFSLFVQSVTISFSGSSAVADTSEYS